MLSILIPTFNYPIKDLISSLEKRLTSVDFDYEILCLDDGSKLYVSDNKAICDAAKNTTHHISNKNNGRITSRKWLATQAKYNWLLFLDADVNPKSEDFISNYLKYLDNNYSVIYGGFCYDTKPPKNDFILRWKYGKTYEQVDARQRNKNPYKVVISGNFLIKKTTFLDINAEIFSDGYGYDNLFGAIMKSKNITVFHIDNNVIHNGLDENAVFLKKVENAVETIFNFYSKNKSKPTENNLIELYKTLKKIGLSRIINFVFKFTEKSLRRQLLSDNPNIKLLQFYKLGYLCSLSKSKA